ncbi:MAG: serine/threonine protein kinase, partial [Myxococcaceae bacterium]|nr:serine/threonine protein kinase [Myxococcaceae bacterium]
MGVVYRAIHPLIGRNVAVKVLRPDLVNDPEQSGRFLKEAQALSTIKHQGIIDIITFGTLPDGRQFMVTEFLEGEPLDKVLQRDGRLNERQALGFVDDILAALSAAHRMGVVHRDLKPSNVFVSVQSNGERHVKLLDFGLAKQQPVEFAGKDASLDGARASLMIGTPEYLAPEQACGLQATPQTDLYCLGVMLFEMLAGRLPFLGSTVVELMRQHVMEKPPRLGALVPVSPQVDGLLESLLQKKPELRPASADATRELVRRAMPEATAAARVTAVEFPVVSAPAAREPESLPLAPVVRSRSRWPYVVPVLAAAGVGLVFALGPGAAPPR